MWAEMLRATGTSCTRADALSVAAVTRGRNLICSIATMPLEEVNEANEVVRSVLLRQIDPDVPNLVTIAQTVEDLLFEGIAWWRITAKTPAGYPFACRRLDPATVSLNPPEGRTPAPLPSGLDPRSGVVWIDGKQTSGSEVIRFDSPNPGLLAHGGREVRRAVALDRAAAMYADDPRPLDYFTPAEGADEPDDADVKVILGTWRAARRRGGTGWVPRAMRYNTVESPAPRELQLAELQTRVTLDVANRLGVDPEELGVSTTSRTYANDVDRRRNKLNDVLRPYMDAITQRLSMGDVTTRPRRVRFNTTDYLLPNPTDRWAIYSTAKGLGAMTVPEIREAEGMPELEEPPAPEVQPMLEDPDQPEGADDGPVTVDASVGASHTFAGDERGGLTFVDLPTEQFSVNREGRVIEGLVLPYDSYATKYGIRMRFERGSLRWDADNPGRVKLLRDHDVQQPIGRAIQLRDTSVGVLARFKVARGPEGDRALELAEDGVLDGFSVGVDFDMDTDTRPDPRDRGAVLVLNTDWRETSLTAVPTFQDARVTRVAASQMTGGGPVPDTETPSPEAPAPAPEGTDHEAAGLQLTQDQLTAMLSVPGVLPALTRPPAPAAEPPAAGNDGGLQLTSEQVSALAANGTLGVLLGLHAAPAAPAPEPEVIRPEVVNPNPDGSRVTFVREALPYRFDRRGHFSAAEHEFSADLHEMALANDHRGEHSDAGKRVMGLFRAYFADTDTADVATLNPNIQRPDMYVDQRDFRYPIWEAINRGAPPNGVQPFVFPKFSTASGLVGDHTQAVEPTGGTFTTTSQTVTPTAISGKASITREVWDMGGNPAVSTLIFAQMVRGWREGLESAAATFLNTLTAAADITLGVAVIDEQLQAAWDAAIADLQFERGYDFSVFAVERVLYKAFVNAVDNNGRKLYAIINPTDATGRADARFRSLDLGGVIASPSWALASTPAALNNSWLFDPATVHGWASAPQRLEFPGSGGAAAGVEYKPVAHVDLAIWGYKAIANSDVGGVRQVTYDSTAP